VPEAKTAVEAVVENLIQPVLLRLQTKHKIGNQNMIHVLFSSVAEQDSGSSAFLTIGSGIRDG
jgi:hypothetical protein